MSTVLRRLAPYISKIFEKYFNFNLNREIIYDSIKLAERNQNCVTALLDENLKPITALLRGVRFFLECVNKSILTNNSEMPVRGCYLLSHSRETDGQTYTQTNIHYIARM